MMMLEKEMNVIRFFVVVLFALMGLGNTFAAETPTPTEVLHLRYAPQVYNETAEEAATLAAWKLKQGREVSAWKAKQALEVAAWKERVIAEHAALMKVRTQHYELYLQWCDLRVQHEGALLHDTSLDAAIQELETKSEFKDLLATRERTQAAYKDATETVNLLYQEAIDHIEQVYRDELGAIEKQYSPSL